MTARALSFIRVIVLVVSLVLALIVAWKTWEAVRADPAAPKAGPCATTVVAARGIAGSEKLPFLEDPQVKEILRCAGLDLRISGEGSRRMVDQIREAPKTFDFAFPSSSSTAKTIHRLPGARPGEYLVFSSVMAVATWTRTADLLRRNGYVRRIGNREALDVMKLIEASRKGTHWYDLKGNETSANRNLVLVNTTNPADSNSAIMFVSMVSAILNGGSPIAGKSALPKVMPDVCRMISDQGEQANTSGVLFEEYLSRGEDTRPMALVYESQFLDQVSHPKLLGDDTHVLLYPNPTAYAKHTVVAFTDAGDAVGDVLVHNPELQALATRYGFRPLGQVPQDWPDPGVGVDPPAYELLEAMLAQIDHSETTGNCQ